MANHLATQNRSQNVNDQNSVSKIPLAVVVVPLLAQGHLNQLLHLSRLISAYNIPIHIVGTTTHNRQAKLRVHGWDALSVANINFHDFPSPPFSNPLPDPNSSFPTQMMPLLNSSQNLREPIYNLAMKLFATVKKIVVIYDDLMAYVVQDIGSIPNLESYCFQSISAFSLYSFFMELGNRMPSLATEVAIVTKVPSIVECCPLEFLGYIKFQEEVSISKSGVIYNTSRVIEDLYLDLLAKENFCGIDKHWAIGPFNPVSLPEKQDSISISRHECLEWLGNWEPNSVIFISFGSSCTFLDEQVKELALGLERSEQKFIWVLRDADKVDIFAGEVRKIELPEGFEERIRERGIIMRDWAPQLEILGHPATGGFISHCGWNSCMESISMGVPIATWPMHTDQPLNAILITKVLKNGVELKDWDRRDEVVPSTRVENVVRKLMDSNEGDEIRKRAIELGDDVKRSLMDGGDTRKEMDSFITHISR